MPGARTTTLRANSPTYPTPIYAECGLTSMSIAGSGFTGPTKDGGCCEDLGRLGSGGHHYASRLWGRSGPNRDTATDEYGHTHGDIHLHPLAHQHADGDRHLNTDTHRATRNAHTCSARQ